MRRDQIAQAALELVAEHGPAELSMARIADRLGLATSAMYRHFPGKDEIIDAVIDLVGSRLAANLSAASRAAATPFKRLEFLLQRHLQLVRENGGIPRLLFSGEVFCGSGAKRERLFHWLIAGYLARVTEIIREGQRAGSIGKSMTLTCCLSCSRPICRRDSEAPGIPKLSVLRACVAISFNSWSAFV